MSFISPQGEQSTSAEIAMVTALNNLPVSGAGQAVQKTGATSFANFAPSAMAGGSNTQVQYNSLTSLAGAAGFVFDGTSKITLGVAGSSVGAVAFNNATSGTITLQAVTGPMGTEILSLPAVTDTLVGKATTDTFTNKTFDTASAGNVFKINGTQISDILGSGKAVLASASTGTGGIVYSTSPGFTTAANPISNDGAALGTTLLQWSDLFLALGAVINFNNGDATITHSAGTLTVAGTLALGSNNLTLTGSIASTGSRVTKGWFTDLQVTNAISGSVTGNAGTVTNATFTTALTVNTGTLTLTASALNTSVLTIGAGAVSVSGSNTGDQTITLTGAVTGSGTGSFATTIATPGTLTVSTTNSTATAHTHAITSSSAPGAAASLLATDSSGIIGLTGTRITKIWLTDIESTNMPTVGGTALTSTFLSLTGGTLTGDLALTTHNITLTGSIAATGSRVTKGWFTDIESTNMITINGTSLASATVTFTNKRITKRDTTTTQSATPTINTDNTDHAHITGLAQAITSFTTNLSGTPVAGDTLWIDITDNGTARAITWGTSFEASGNVALPTTTVISTRLDVGFVWNEVTSKWRCIATA